MTHATVRKRYVAVSLALILGTVCLATESQAATSKSSVTFDNQSGEPALVKLMEKATSQAKWIKGMD